MAEESIGEVRRDLDRLSSEVSDIHPAIRENYLSLLSGDKDRVAEIKELQKQVEALQKAMDKEVTDLKARIKDLDAKVAKIKK